MRVRHAKENDLNAYLSVLSVLEGPWPVDDGVKAQTVWTAICDHPGTTVLLGELEDEAISTATLHVLPNLTFRGSPYALIENVAVLPNHQGRGAGRQIMQAAIDLAWERDCYKIMLMSGVGNNAAGYYEKLGFSTKQKQAFVMRRAPVRN